MYSRLTLNSLCVPVDLELRNPHAFVSPFLGCAAASLLCACVSVGMCMCMKVLEEERR